MTKNLKFDVEIKKTIHIDREFDMEKWNVLNEEQRSEIVRLMGIEHLMVNYTLADFISNIKINIKQ